MRKVSLAVLLAAWALSGGGTDLSACGDKFLLVGHGRNVQRAYCALHPASVLIYINPKSTRAAALGDPQFLASLKLAGHKPEAVTEPSRLGQLLSSGRYDIVLTDVSDATTLLDQETRMADTKPTLVPILYKPNKVEIAAAEKQFGTVLQAPDKITHFLGVIDGVMKARLGGSRAKASITE